MDKYFQKPLLFIQYYLKRQKLTPDLVFKNFERKYLRKKIKRKVQKEIKNEEKFKNIFKFNKLFLCISLNLFLNNLKIYKF